MFSPLRNDYLQNKKESKIYLARDYHCCLLHLELKICHSNSMSKLGEFFPIGQIMVVRDSTKQIWQTLSVHYKSKTTIIRINLQKCHDLVLQLREWWNQLLGRSSLDNHIIYYGQVFNMHPILPRPNWASNGGGGGGKRRKGDAPLMKALFTCQYDLVDVVKLTLIFHTKNVW